MIFKQDLLPKFSLIQDNSGDERVYHTPNGKTYPSVTSVLSRILDKSYLDVWKNNIGEQQAKKILRQASVRGTIIHNLMERYVLGEENPEQKETFINKATFNSLKKVLDKHVSIIHGIEYQIWSDRLRIAGTSDLPCTFDGVKSILDYKTSKQIKREEDILGYFLQSACYSISIYEQTGILFPQIVIAMAVDFQQEPLVFVRNTTDFIDQVDRLINKRNSA